jgi:N-acetylneuraminic acid mutarotase
MDQFVFAHMRTIHFRDADDKMTKTALNEARKDPESDYTPCYPAAARVVDAILARVMETTADVQMRLPAAGVAVTTIPSQTISVSESLCADPLLNRVQWEVYLPAHSHEFIARELSEMARCCREALEAQDPPPVVATSAGSKAPEMLPHDSTPAPPAPEVPPSVVVALRVFVTKACRAFSQLASGAWTLVSCGAAFHICTASFCTRKQIHRRALAGGRLVLAMLPQLLSTVGAAKLRPFRSATANMWAEGKPTGFGISAMAAGQDGSLYILADTKSTDNVAESNLFKIDLDTKEWNKIEPRGSVRPSVAMHSMAAVGSDLYVFGGKLARSNTLFRFSATEQKWELLGAPQVLGSPPSARTDHGMVAVGSDLYVFGGHTEGGTVINPTGPNTYANSDSNELFRFSTLTLRWEQLYAQQGSGPPPSARGGHGMVVVVRDLSFYVFGGMTSWKGICPHGSTPPVGYCSDVEVEVGLLNDLFRFSTKEHKWEQLNVSGSPSARADFGMVNIGGSDLYVYGGSGQDENDFFRFSTTERNWESLATLVEGGPARDRNSFSFRGMVAMGLDFYMFDLYEALFRFSTTDKQWKQLDAQQASGSAPCTGYSNTCWGTSLSAVGSDLYVFESSSNGLFRFSTTEQQWKKLNVSGTPPSMDFGYTMTVVDTYIYVFGSPMQFGGWTRLSNLFRFSTSELKWEQLQVSGPDVYWLPAEMVSVDNDLYVFRGHESNHDLSVLFRFSTKDKEWIKLDAVLGTPPGARTSYGMVAVDRDLYIFGGYTRTGEGGRVAISNDLFRFSTKEQQWKELKVSGSPPRRRQFGMATVGRDFYVFGGYTHTDAGDSNSNDLFRFSTTEQKWEKIQVSGTPPSARSFHRMAAVGNNLYSFGGDFEASGSFFADPFLVYTTQQVFAWPASSFSPMWFTRVYDGDIIQITGDADWPSEITVELCSSANLPCSLTIAGSASAYSTIRRHSNSRIVCEAASGCTGVTMRHVTVACSGEASAAGPLHISGAGAVATIEGATFSDCVSVEDGGSIRAYNGATVKVSGTTFQRSSSQVPFFAMSFLQPLDTPTKCIDNICQPDTQSLHVFLVHIQ